MTTASTRTSREILSSLDDLTGLIESQSDAVNAQGSLTAPVMTALRSAQVFSALFPAEMGGPAMRLDDQVQLIAKLAYSDASVAWCVSILQSGGFFAGTIGSQTATVIYPHINTPTATTTFPLGVAHEQDDGTVAVSGHWMFASGIKNSEYAVLGVKLVDTAGATKTDPLGEPIIAWVWLPVSAISVESSWESTGLNGTGSVEISADNITVPASHIVDYTKVPRQGSPDLPPNSRYRCLLAAKGVGVPLGIARRARDEYVKQVSTSARKGSHRESVAIAKVDSLVTACDGIVNTLYRDVSDAIWKGEPLTSAVEGRLNASMPLIGSLCFDAVDTVLDAIGARAVLTQYPFERLFRDIATIRRHLVYQQNYYQTAGDLMIGIAETGSWK